MPVADDDAQSARPAIGMGMVTIIIGGGDDGGDHMVDDHLAIKLTETG